MMWAFFFFFLRSVLRHEVAAAFWTCRVEFSKSEFLDGSWMNYLNETLSRLLTVLNVKLVHTEREKACMCSSSMINEGVSDNISGP